MTKLSGRAHYSDQLANIPLLNLFVLITLLFPSRPIYSEAVGPSNEVIIRSPILHCLTDVQLVCASEGSNVSKHDCDIRARDLAQSRLGGDAVVHTHLD
jgi:hypothetical protein